MRKGELVFCTTVSTEAFSEVHSLCSQIFICGPLHLLFTTHPPALHCNARAQASRVAANACVRCTVREDRGGGGEGFFAGGCAGGRGR